MDYSLDGLFKDGEISFTFDEDDILKQQSKTFAKSMFLIFNSFIEQGFNSNEALVLCIEIMKGVNK